MPNALNEDIAGRLDEVGRLLHEQGANRYRVHDGHDGEQQGTVITAEFGGLEGRRIVRGREAECATHYEKARLPLAGQGSSEGFDPASDAASDDAHAAKPRAGDIHRQLDLLPSGPEEPEREGGP